MAVRRSAAREDSRRRPSAAPVAGPRLRQGGEELEMMRQKLDAQSQQLAALAERVDALMAAQGNLEAEVARLRRPQLGVPRPLTMRQWGRFLLVSKTAVLIAPIQMFM